MKKLNNKTRKLRYINIKNSWRKDLRYSKTIDITITMHNNLLHNPKYPLNKIFMDFRNREDIVKYGIVKIRFI